jgi:hypothetical protein
VTEEMPEHYLPRKEWISNAPDGSFDFSSLGWRAIETVHEQQNTPEPRHDDTGPASAGECGAARAPNDAGGGK